MASKRLVDEGVQFIKSNKPIGSLFGFLDEAFNLKRFGAKKADEIFDTAMDSRKAMMDGDDFSHDPEKVKLFKQLGEDAEFTARGQSKKAGVSVLNNLTMGTTNRNGERVGGTLENTWDFLTAADKAGDSRTKRYGIAAARTGGALFVGGSAVRMATGNGSPVTDKYGERDIAGIPFV